MLRAQIFIKQSTCSLFLFPKDCVLFCGKVDGATDRTEVFRFILSLWFGPTRATIYDVDLRFTKKKKFMGPKYSRHQWKLNFIVSFWMVRQT